jgi:O-antigen/teichoic acid export membrane protein
MNDSQRIALNAALMFAKQGIMAVLGVFFVGYLARKVGVADWGEFQASLAVTNVLTVVAGIGVRGYLAREVAVEPSLGPRHLGAALAIRGVTGALLLGGTAAIAFAARSGLASTLLMLASVSQLATLLYSTMWLSFEAHERFQYIVYVEVAARVLVIGLASALLWFGFGIVAAASAFVVGNVIELGLTYYFLSTRLYRPKLETTPRDLARIAWASVPIGLCGAIATALTQSDRVLLRVLVGETEVGIYSAAWVLTDNFTMIPDVFLASAFAAGMRTYAYDRPRFAWLFERCMVFAALLGLPIAAGVVVLAPEVIELVYGQRFAASSTVLRVLVCQVPIAFAYQVGTLPLLAGKREKTIGKLLGSMLVGNVLLNLLLAPRFGGLGSAVASLSVSLVGLVGTLWLNREWIRHVRGTKILGVLASTATMAAAAWATNRALGMWAAMGAGVICYAVLVVATRAVTLDELSALLRRRIAKEASEPAVSPVLDLPPPSSNPLHARVT